MPMRQFLRGGYKDIRELTVITNHGRPVATWMPQKHAGPRKIAGVDSKSAHTPSTGE